MCDRVRPGLLLAVVCMLLALSSRAMSQVFPGGTIPETELPQSPLEDRLGVTTSYPEYASWCGPPGRIWADVQYLLWWTEGMSIPPLVTTSPQGTPVDLRGVLGQPGTSILYGNDDILTDARHGLRFRTGVWIDPANQFGFQGEFFGLNEEDTTFFATSVNNNPILARPFFNINPRDPPGGGPFDPPARESAQQLDTVVVDAFTRLYALGAVFRANLACETWGPNQYSRVDLLAGYRHLHLKEGLQIREAVMGPAVSFDIFDRFDTRNEFHGADLGAVWEISWQRWSFELLMRSAIGNVRQVVDIQGGTTIATDNQPTQSFVGGLLAQRTNIGRHSRDRFGLVPELGLTLGYQILPRLQLTAGYTFLYLSDVVRPGEQIDRTVNPDLLPPELVPVEGALRPQFAFQEVSVWAQGLHLGLEGRW